jgi:hypothetical protein
MKLIETIGNLAVMCVGKQCVSLALANENIAIMYLDKSNQLCREVCKIDETDKINKMIKIVREL